MKIPERITERQEFVRYKNMAHLGPCGSCMRNMQWVNFRALCGQQFLGWVSASDCINNGYICHVSDE